MSPTKSTTVLAAVAVFSLFAAPSREASAPQAGVHPIVDAQSGMLFGGTINGKWIDAEHLAPHLAGGESYRLYRFTRFLGESAGSKPDAPDVNCGPQIGLESYRSGALLAIGGAWNALPRKPHLQSVAQPVYQQAVRAFFQKRGVRNPQFEITQIVRCDLDGNGQDEVLISAEPLSGGSLLLLRKIVQGRVRTIPILNPTWQYWHPATRLVALLDVNGDGCMKIITQTNGTDSVGKEIWQMDGDKPRLVLDWACGH